MKTFNQFLVEVNNKMLAYMQSLVPSWPPYVVSDILYKGFSPRLKMPTNDPRQIKEFLQSLAKEFGYNNPNQIQWKLENVVIKKDIFCDDTLRRMQERGMGQFNPYQVPNDTKRHQGAQNRLQNNPNIKIKGYSGPSNSEPIILIRHRDGKYELFEGWHRTMQSMLAQPEGYQQKAYILQSLF